MTNIHNMSIKMSAKMFEGTVYDELAEVGLIYDSKYDIGPLSILVPQEIVNNFEYKYKEKLKMLELTQRISIDIIPKGCKYALVDQDSYNIMINKANDDLIDIDDLLTKIVKYENNICIDRGIVRKILILNQMGAAREADPNFHIPDDVKLIEKFNDILKLKDTTFTTSVEIVRRQIRFIIKDQNFRITRLEPSHTE